jgi:hypothetical protein
MTLKAAGLTQLRGGKQCSGGKQCGVAELVCRRRRSNVVVDPTLVEMAFTLLCRVHNAGRNINEIENYTP